MISIRHYDGLGRLWFGAQDLTLMVMVWDKNGGFIPSFEGSKGLDDLKVSAR
jgi:hypothetical protein